MIFTSIAAALLAAVTGMTTIRTPGGNEQQVEVKPTYAWDMTVADISDSMEFLRNLRHFRSIDLTDTGLSLSEIRYLSNQIESTFDTIFDGLREANFRPVKMAYYNVYNIEEIPGRRLIPTRYEENIEYSVITFFDNHDNDIHFLDTCGKAVFDDYNPAYNVVPYNSNMDDVGKIGIKAIADIFVKTGLSSLEYMKTYENVADGTIITDTSLVDMLGSNQSGTCGLFFQNWAPWNDWEEIWYFLLSRKNRHDIIKPGLTNAPMVLDGSIISNPMGSVFTRYALEETDILQGQTVLESSQVITGVNAAMSMNYNQFLQLNDLIILE